MGDNNLIRRRSFLRLSSTAALAGLAGRIGYGKEARGLQEMDEIIRRVGTFPRRKLGYSGREVSVMIGAGDMAPQLVQAGVMCGMNYWHKANHWMSGGAPDIIVKNREDHFCQVTVDRAGIDHYQGHFDEEEHYRFVREAVKKTGLGYFDDMQLHYGYHNTAELKDDRSFIRAFDRLKKEGLVKHLCLSQHSYEGSPRVKNGQSAAEILTAVIEDGLYEHAQFMYSYDGDTDLDKFMELALSKSFGTTAMKTARGIGRMRQDQSFMARLPEGTSPHNAMVRWLTTRTKLDAAVIRVRNMEEFVETYSGAGKELRKEDQQVLDMMIAVADTTACRLCGKCQSHCPQHIPITDILRFERYAMDDHDWMRASSLYAGLPTKGDSCISCNTCVDNCPLHLRIPDKLAKAHILMS